MVAEHSDAAPMDYAIWEYLKKQRLNKTEIKSLD